MILDKKSLVRVTPELLEYIEEKVLVQYTQAEAGHSIEHILDVIKRIFELNGNLSLNMNDNMLLTIAAYHDIGRLIDDENHEIESGRLFQEDENIKRFFTEEEIQIIREAIEDHRASLEGEPRSEYGKLISSADRNINLDQPLTRTYAYRLKKNPNHPLDEIIKESFDHLVEKFGNEGYASTVYHDDGAYEKYLSDLNQLLNDYELFKTKYCEVNNIEAVLFQKTLI